MTRPGAQFPELTPENLGDRFVDPAALDREVEGLIEAEPPSWLLIAAAWCAGLALIVMTWSF